MTAGPQKIAAQGEKVAGFTLSLLGEFSLVDTQGQTVSINGKKNRALLAILALSPNQTMTRERLSGLLWGDRGEEQARNSLRQSLAVLRKELGPDGNNLIRSLDEALTLRTEAIMVDALQVVAGSTSGDLATVRAAGWLIWGDPQEPNRRKALALAQRAAEIAPNNSVAHSTLGYILLYERRWDDAELQYDAALRLNPNNADALADIAYFYVMNGKPKEAVKAAAKALRLNPRPPGWYYWITGTAQVANGQYDNAVVTLRQEETYRSASRRMLAAALALLGRTSEAQEEASLFLATSPHWRISTWAENEPFKNPKDTDFWIDAFRLAGLPG